MAATAASPRDWHKIQTFAVKVLSDIIAQQIGPLSIVADRLSLFTTLAHAGPLQARVKPAGSARDGM